MPIPLQRFRAYEIAEDPGGTSLELWRSDREVVCLASEPARQRWVELHVVAGVDTQDPSELAAAETFRTHIQALLRVRDRRVLEVLEAGEDEGALFYVTEFVDGEPLDAYLARCAPLPAWWAVELARQLTRGLAVLRAAPAMLARVQVFNARLTMEGESTADTLVKLAGFDLGGPANSAAPPQGAEEHAIREVGSLLCYALSGLPAEQITATRLSALPLPPEVGDLLGRLLGRPGRTALRELTALQAALTACALSPSLTTSSARLPPALRPRLPLAAHFPTLAGLAAEIGERLRLERSGFDAAYPYAQRAFVGTRPVTVQLLPPARLLAPQYIAQIRHAAERLRSHATPHALTILELPAIDDPAWFLEETAPRFSLAGVRRLRPAMTPSEAAFLMRAFDTAAQALESLGLAPAALCPHEIFLDFTGPTPPGDDQIAAQPATSWPPFHLKMRVHPTAVHLAQPNRFLRERLLDPCPPRHASDPPTGSPAGLGSPSAADCAALFAWLCGGLAGVPADLTPLITGALEQSGQPSRRAFLDALAPLIPKHPQSAPPRPATAPATAPASTKSAESPAPARVSKPEQAPKKRRRRSPSRPSTSRPNHPAAPRPTDTGAPPPSSPADPPSAHEGAPSGSIGFLQPDPEAGWLTNGAPAPDEPEAGFAEVLLGFATEHSFAPPPASFTSTDDTLDPENEAPPIGALFGVPLPDPLLDPAVPFEGHRIDFSSAAHFDRGPGWGRLFIMIVLLAMIIAAITAHFTGLAFWRQPP